MSEGQGDASDVRAFLPRPGEPVDEYAERLRALHRDLTLVLQAVERGLAAADEHAPPPPPPVPAPAPAVTAVVAAPEPQLHGVGAAGRGAYVEVVAPPTGPSGRFDPAEERRRPPEPVVTSAAAFPPRPSVRPAEPALREPVWVEGGETASVDVDPAPAAVAEPARPGVPPLVITATVLGWLVVVALLVALLIDR